MLAFHGPSLSQRVPRPEPFTAHAVHRISPLVSFAQVAAALADATLRNEELTEQEAALQERQQQQLLLRENWQQQLRSSRGSHRRRSSGHHHHYHHRSQHHATASRHSERDPPIIMAPSQRNVASKSALSGGGGEGDGQSAAYLEYLRQCLRQGRSAAEEVVEVMRGNMLQRGGSAAQAASTLALQIKAAEEQLGIAPVPVPSSVAAGWLSSPTGASNLH